MFKNALYPLQKIVFDYFFLVGELSKKLTALTKSSFKLAFNQKTKGRRILRSSFIHIVHPLELTISNTQDKFKLTPLKVTPLKLIPLLSGLKTFYSTKDRVEHFKIILKKIIDILFQRIIALDKID